MNYEKTQYEKTYARILRSSTGTFLNVLSPLELSIDAQSLCEEMIMAVSLWVKVNYPTFELIEIIPESRLDKVM
jgi:hypothetical protein